MCLKFILGQWDCCIKKNKFGKSADFTFTKLFWLLKQFTLLIDWFNAVMCFNTSATAGGMSKVSNFNRIVAILYTAHVCVITEFYIMTWSWICRFTTVFFIKLGFLHMLPYHNLKQRQSFTNTFILKGRICFKTALRLCISKSIQILGNLSTASWLG